VVVAHATSCNEDIQVPSLISVQLSPSSHKHHYYAYKVPTCSYKVVVKLGSLLYTGNAFGQQSS
jgi:hypothetical protein